MLVFLQQRFPLSKCHASVARGRFRCSRWMMVGFDGVGFWDILSVDLWLLCSNNASIILMWPLLPWWQWPVNVQASKWVALFYGVAGVAFLCCADVPFDIPIQSYGLHRATVEHFNSKLVEGWKKGQVENAWLRWVATCSSLMFTLLAKRLVTQNTQCPNKPWRPFDQNIFQKVIHWCYGKSWKIIYISTSTSDIAKSIILDHLIFMS